MSKKQEPIINGIDVSGSVLTATNNDVYYSQNAVDELLNKIKRLQQENEELKSLLDFEIQKREVFADKSIKYEFVLEEIREIAEYSIMHNSNLNSNYQIILQNINEVLNDRD